MIKELIKGIHTSEETALVVENYPYGFKLKTKIRFWIETNKRGDRFLSQTLNPKTQLWNKPKASIYVAVMVMYYDEEGHVQFKAMYPTTDKEVYNSFMVAVQGFEFNEMQQKQLRLLRAYAKVYDNVDFKIVEGNLSKDEQEKHDKEQKEVKAKIDEAVRTEYIRDKLEGQSK